MAEAALPATSTRPPLEAASSATAIEPQKLDELMLAMDVVDTLRHQENLAARELDETRRDVQLSARLRQIYQGQGIEVPDRVLQEGVQALKESRIVYTPPPPGFGRTLALAWVDRRQAGKGLLGLLAAAAVGWGAYRVGVVRPAQQRTEQARAQAEREQLELTDILPRPTEEALLEQLRVEGVHDIAQGVVAGQAVLIGQEAAQERQGLLAPQADRHEVVSAGQRGAQHEQQDLGQQVEHW